MNILERLRADGESPERERLITLIETGQLLPATEVPNRDIIACIRMHRGALREVVQLIANGGYARNDAHREQAWNLLQRFGDLSETALAEELIALGLNESTRSFGRELGSYRYVLFAFRRAVQRWQRNGNGKQN